MSTNAITLLESTTCFYVYRLHFYCKVEYKSFITVNYAKLKYMDH